MVNSIYSNRKELAAVLQNDSQMPCDIRQLLVEGGFVSRKRLDDLMLEHDLANSNHAAIGTLLAAEGLLDDEDFSQLYAASIGLPYVNLMTFDVDVNVLRQVPADVARQYLLMPLMIHDEKLVVAMHDPLDSAAKAQIGFLYGKIVIDVLASRAGIEYAITHFYSPTDDENALKDISIPGESEAQEMSEAESFRLAEDKPTVRLVHHIIDDAVNSRASDIHIRPCEDHVDLLFRIDGNLRHIRSFSKSVLPAVVSRIKILSGMNVAEHRLPQDGQAQIDHHCIIDLRISIIPSIYGESTVIRILDKSMSLRQITDVGFTKKDQHIFSGLLRKSHGLILVTGPTGCGKSTTLYAALQDVITTGNNIITVEDPVEYHIDGLMQIQVNPVIGFTFVRALRHILRHDPDVIMIGEIRDLETARMAVESSLTGHIVLSTLHTNSAATSVTRLIEMGIPSYLVNTSLLAILAQRLVRRNCQYCMTEDEVSEEVRKVLGIGSDEQFFHGAGCEHCQKTGYQGRMAVYELLTVTPGLRKLLELGTAATDVERQAVSDGMVTLTNMALQAARERKTSIEEVFRVRLT